MLVMRDKEDEGILENNTGALSASQEHQQRQQPQRRIIANNNNNNNVDRSSGIVMNPAAVTTRQNGRAIPLRHERFIESMERHGSALSNQVIATHNDNEDGNNDAPSSTSSQWRNMALELDWTEDRVKRYAFQYLASLLHQQQHQQQLQQRHTPRDVIPRNPPQQQQQVASTNGVSTSHETITTAATYLPNRNTETTTMTEVAIGITDETMNSKPSPSVNAQGPTATNNSLTTNETQSLQKSTPKQADGVSKINGKNSSLSSSTEKKAASSVETSPLSSPSTHCTTPMQTTATRTNGYKKRKSSSPPQQQQQQQRRPPPPWSREEKIVMDTLLLENVLSDRQVHESSSPSQSLIDWEERIMSHFPNRSREQIRQYYNQNYATNNHRNHDYNNTSNPS